MKKSRKNISKKLTKKKMRGGAIPQTEKYKEFQPNNLFTGMTSIGALKKQSNRDKIMNENMKLIYDLLKKDLKEDLNELKTEQTRVLDFVNTISTKLVDPSIPGFANTIGKLNEIQEQFEDKNPNPNLKKFENHSMRELLLEIINALKIKVETNTTTTTRSNTIGDLK